MSYYYDDLYIKTPKLAYSREITKNLKKLWIHNPTYITQLGGDGNKNKDLQVIFNNNCFEILLNTEDMIEGMAFQHINIVEEMVSEIYTIIGMKEIEFSGWLRVGCYHARDCAYAEFHCKDSVLTIKKVLAPIFDMDTCPYCGEVFDKALFSLDIYRPQKEYLCPKCHSAIQANFEQKKIDLKSLAK